MKSKKTLVIILIAVVVLIAGSYTFNRWQQQRLISQTLQELYGVDAGKVGGITGITGKIAEEMAKEEAKQKAEEASEAAKIPEDKYNETKEMPAYDDNSKTVTSEAREIVEKVFGKAKLTSFSSGFYTGANQSGISAFTISRLTSTADVGAINKTLTDKGLQIMGSSIDNQEALIMAGTDNVQYTVQFNIGGQEVGISIIKTAE